MSIRLEIVSGKGGVGKSAVAAGLARARAHEGARVLALGTTDPRGLGSHLGLAGVSIDPVEVRDGLFAATILPGPALQQYLKIQLRVATPRMSLATRAFDLLATAAPGIREVITIGKVIWEAERGGWDVVVVDAPATGQLGSYLTAPSTVAGIVPSGRVLEQSTWMREVLAADTTRLTLVTLLEELPVSETREALAEVGGLTGSTRIVANRVLAPLAVPAGAVAAAAPGPMRDAALLHESLQHSQARWADELQPALSIPHQFGVLTPQEVAARLAEELA